MTLNFTTEVEGIPVAQAVLSDVRILLENMDEDVFLAPSKGDGRYTALQLQLESLEDMLRVITDSRYARSIVDPDSELEVEVENAHMELLQFIVATARDIVHEEFDSTSKRERTGKFKQQASPTMTRASSPFNAPGSTSRRSSQGYPSFYKLVDSDSRMSPSMSWYPDSDSDSISGFRPWVEDESDRESVVDSVFEEPLGTEDTLFDIFKTELQPLYSPYRDDPTGSPTEPQFHPGYCGRSGDDQGLETTWLESETGYASSEEDILNFFPGTSYASSEEDDMLSFLSKRVRKHKLDATLNKKSTTQKLPAPKASGSVSSSSRTSLEGVLVKGQRKPAKTVQPSLNATPPCIACREPILTALRVILSCGHSYCSSCMVELVVLYNRQESELHPLRCCGKEITANTIRPALSRELFLKYTDKQLEYGTPTNQRLYCPKPECGRFIQRIAVRRSARTNQGTVCPSCSAAVCINCKELVHTGEDCETHKDNVLLQNLAKEKEWQTCNKCHRIVEKIDGCLHMTCPCGFQFCYRCGAEYKGPGMCGH